MPANLFSLFAVFLKTFLIIHSFLDTLGPPDHARNQDSLASLFLLPLGVDLALSESDVLYVFESMLDELAHRVS